MVFFLFFLFSVLGKGRVDLEIYGRGYFRYSYGGWCRFFRIYCCFGDLLSWVKYWVSRGGFISGLVVTWGGIGVVRR